MLYLSNSTSQNETRHLVTLLLLTLSMQMWKKIIESSSQELLDLERQGYLQLGQLNPDQFFYVKALIAYFRENGTLIENELRLSANKINIQIKILVQLRLEILKNDFNETDILNLRAQAKIQLTENIFKAECAFILGFLFQKHSLYEQSEAFFKEASAYFMNENFIRKGLRAQLSALAIFSCRFPESRLFSDYHNILQTALFHGENLTAGTCLLNISREYQKLEAYDLAFETIHKSIEHFEKDHFGSREHGLALIHRAHVALQTKRTESVLKDIYMALSNPHSDVQGSCKTLAQKYQLNLKTLSQTSILPTWKERTYDESAIRRPMGKSESTLLKLLTEKPQSKFELIEILYGNKISFESSENRLKNLIFRIRKIRGIEIRLVNDKYNLFETNTPGKKIS